MHNHYLGLLKHHCRKIWGMRAAPSDSVGDAQEIVPPHEQDLSAGFDRLFSGTEAELASCKKKVIRYLCLSLGIPYKKEKKADLVESLLVWVR